MSRQTNGESESPVATSVERMLRLPSDFVSSLLLDADDWSFVVKAHALLESCLNMITARYIAREHDHYRGEIMDVVSRLNTSDTRCGKIAFLRAFGVLDHEAIKAIRRLSEIRNQLVHDISNVAFSFSTHVAVMNKDQLKSEFRTFHQMSKSDAIDDADLAAFSDDPRTIINSSVQSLLGDVIVAVWIAESDERVLAMIRRAEGLIINETEEVLTPDEVNERAMKLVMEWLEEATPPENRDEDSSDATT
jgi:DNA-binding MltR family transcriptional regulator